MSKSWRKRGPACSRRQAFGGEADPVATAEELRAQHLALEELEHERVVLRHSGNERCADAALPRRRRVLCGLVLAVDREETRVLARDADDRSSREASATL